MKRVRFHGNNADYNVFEFIGFVDGKIACLPLKPFHKCDVGKITLFSTSDVVFMDYEEDRPEYMKEVNSFLNEESVRARLLKYDYIKYVQGTADRGSEYAFIYAPNDASFNNVRSRLIKERYKENDHEIVLESVVDLTIDS